MSRGALDHFSHFNLVNIISKKQEQNTNGVSVLRWFHKTTELCRGTACLFDNIRVAKSKILQGVALLFAPDKSEHTRILYHIVYRLSIIEKIFFKDKASITRARTMQNIQKRTRREKIVLQKIVVEKSVSL